MDSGQTMKALMIIVNAGFADQVIEIARGAGASGATIINARGEGTTHRSFLGITVDCEREIVLTLVAADTAQRIMDAIGERAGVRSPARTVCFAMPVDAITIGAANPDMDL